MFETAALADAAASTERDGPAREAERPVWRGCDFAERTSPPREAALLALEVEADRFAVDGADFLSAEAADFLPDESDAGLEAPRSVERLAACTLGNRARRLTASTPLRNRFKFKDRSPRGPGWVARSVPEESFNHLSQLLRLVMMDIVASVFDVLDAQVFIGHRATLEFSGH